MPRSWFGATLPKPAPERFDSPRAGGRGPPWVCSLPAVLVRRSQRVPAIFTLLQLPQQFYRCVRAAPPTESGRQGRLVVFLWRRTVPATNRAQVATSSPLLRATLFQSAPIRIPRSLLEAEAKNRCKAAPFDGFCASGSHSRLTHAHPHNGPKLAKSIGHRAATPTKGAPAPLISDPAPHHRGTISCRRIY
jgi:hypothetical protein